MEGYRAARPSGSSEDAPLKLIDNYLAVVSLMAGPNVTTCSGKML